MYVYVRNATVSPVPARPAIGLPSPVPTSPAALLPARSSFLPVPAWDNCKEPYSSPVPARHALFSLPARSCFLAVPAWAHGEGSPTAIPYRHATPCFPCLPALLSLPYRPGRTVRSPTAIPYRHATPCVAGPVYMSFLPPPRWRENPQELETYGLGI